MNAKNPTRRKFLRALAIGGAGAAAALGGALAFPRSRAKLAWIAQRLIELPLSPEARIARHFDYLDLDPECTRRFVEDWRAHVGPLPRTSALPSEIYARFLLSTDFFAQDADETRRVRYRGFNDPYLTTCANPLARFDD
jgi:hypothetical protein